MMYLATAVNDPKWTAAVISMFTKGRAFHSELVFSDGSALEITTRHIGMVNRVYNWYKWHLIPLPETVIDNDEETKIRERVTAYLQDDPKYDYIGAVFGKWFPHVQLKNRWYCSEFCRDVLKDRIPGLGDDEKWITPDRLMRQVGNYIDHIQKQLVY